MWTASGEYEDIRYETSGDGIAKITIARPEVRNAFRPQTIRELSAAFEVARRDADVGVIIFTGEGDLAFCSGGDVVDGRSGEGGEGAGEDEGRRPDLGQATDEGLHRALAGRPEADGQAVGAVGEADAADPRGAARR